MKNTSYSIKLMTLSYFILKTLRKMRLFVNLLIVDIKNEWDFVSFSTCKAIAHESYGKVLYYTKWADLLTCLHAQESSLRERKRGLFFFLSFTLCSNFLKWTEMKHR